jgi:lipopolysaccharide export system protein LptC
MTAAHHTDPETLRRPDFAKWRAHSRMVRRLRILLPMVIGLILALMAGLVIYRTINGVAQATEANTPIQLVKPRFVGRDGKGRAFVLTAVTAVRDEKDYQRVILDRPTLILDEEGPSPMRVSAKSGVYREDDKVLNLAGGVMLNGAETNFQTASSVFNTATGELEGMGEIAGAGTLGEIIAKSYGVYDKGERIVFKGGVRARIDSK